MSCAGRSARILRLNSRRASSSSANGAGRAWRWSQRASAGASLPHLPGESTNWCRGCRRSPSARARSAISITEDALSDVEVPVRTLQDDEDDVVSVDNAAPIAEHLPDGELVELPGEDHSFRNDEERVLEMTLSFLR